MCFQLKLYTRSIEESKPDCLAQLLELSLLVRRQGSQALARHLRLHGTDRRLVLRDVALQLAATLVPLPQCLLISRRLPFGLLDGLTGRVQRDPPRVTDMSPKAPGPRASCSSALVTRAGSLTSKTVLRPSGPVLGAV